MHFLLVVASLFVFWLLMSGFWVPFLLTAGLASAVLVAAFAHRMGAIDREGQPFHLSWRALTYWPWLIWEIAKAQVHPRIERFSYDLGASQEAQGNLHTIMSRLEAIIGERDADVDRALADFEATGVSEEYSAKELKWHSAANEVRDIIDLVRSTLEANDGTAQSALSKAQAAVQAI